jgi:hypothetical protein
LLLSVLDGGKGSNDSLVVGDGLAIERDVEVNADENALVLEIEVFNRELVDERHDGLSEDESKNGEGMRERKERKKKKKKDVRGEKHNIYRFFFCATKHELTLVPRGVVP